MKDGKQTYIAPEMEVVLIEVEQSIMTASIEDIGDILPEMDW